MKAVLVVVLLFVLSLTSYGLVLPSVRLVKTSRNDAYVKIRKKAAVSRLHVGDKSNEGGKFITLADAATDVQSPLMLILGGFSNEELEVIDDVVDAVITQRDARMRLVPSIVLGEDDRKRKLSHFFSDEKVITERDHELPDRPLKIEIPLVLFSGLQSIEIKNLIYSIRKTFSSKFELEFGDNKRRPIVFAVVVKKTLDKSIDTLYSEVLGDHEANAQKM